MVKVFRQLNIRNIFLPVVFYLFFFLLFSPWAQGEDVIVITVEENQSIRDISKNYLGNPDLWEDVLRANGLRAPHEVIPGMELEIPVKAISEADALLASSLNMIREATGSGARLFAPDIIAESVQLRNDALEFRKAGDLNACIDAARRSELSARKALNICKANQDVPAEAVVSNFKGEVHRRKPNESLWEDIIRNDILLEGERIRTLSKSSTDILFRDESVLRLKENAQALIRKMRSNLLDNSEESRVSLVKGDVYALLAGTNQSKGFKLDIPGVKTRIKSQQFWAASDADGARFANYDGELEISAAGGKVVLKKNQGSIVPANQKPSAPKDLLPGPELLSPENGKIVYNGDFQLSWAAVSGAVLYLLELSRDAAFADVIRSDMFTSSEVPFPLELGEGVFYWRVSSVSEDKLPGQPSQPMFFQIILDEIPPYLLVRSPEEGAIVSVPSVEITGVSESDAVITIDGRDVDIDSRGNYSFNRKLDVDENLLIIAAKDPAGNTTKIERLVTFLPAEEISLSIDPSIPRISEFHFLTQQPLLSIKGETLPGAQVRISSIEHAFQAGTQADDAGHFDITVRVAGTGETFDMAIRSRRGDIRQDRIKIQVDDVPPDIIFSSDVPSRTRAERLAVSGRVADGESLKIGDEQISIDDGSFSKNVELKAGENILRFVAHDRVKNARIIEKKVICDPDPPELIGHSISHRKVKGGESVRIEVQAKDNTSLARVAPYKIRVGKMLRAGILILSRDSGKYTGTFKVPTDIKGEVVLTAVRLSDYPGNVYEYPIQ